MPFVRFVVADIDADSGHRQGAWNAAAALRDRGALSTEDASRVSEIGRWFDRNLPKPGKFTRKRNDSHRRPRALSWFKDTAGDHIQKMRDLSSLLEKHGTVVHTVVSERPGYIVYEDAFQVVAEPFADSGA